MHWSGIEPTPYCFIVERTTTALQTERIEQRLTLSSGKCGDKYRPVSNEEEC